MTTNGLARNIEIRNEFIWNECIGGGSGGGVRACIEPYVRIEIEQCTEYEYRFWMRCEQRGREREKRRPLAYFFAWNDVVVFHHLRDMECVENLKHIRGINVEMKRVW